MSSRIVNDDSCYRKHHFRLSCYPHRLAEFSNLLKGVFGEDSAHSVHGDFQTLGRVPKPAEKSAKHASTEV